MPVYKDECVYTFDNLDSPHGVDVCLKCYLGTSSGPLNFTERHARVANHTAFLNLTRQLKPEFKSKPKEDGIKKLSVAADNDADKFELVTRFKTLAQDVESDFQEAITHVLNSESYYKQKQNEAWELELETCEHVAIHSSLFDGKPPQRLSSEHLSKCTSCELNQNLWLCLECGNLGCGRKQFDGSGGNSHALSHFEQTEHALAIKLGTITPEGHVDLYCYKCNEDRIDPNITEHLRYWGIDVSNQVKTEKSMTELQIEQNISWDFQTSETGEPANYTGMQNLGNTCYLNSVMQSLFGIPEFTNEFKLLDPQSDFEESPDALSTQLSKLRDGLHSQRYTDIAPRMFKHLVGLNHEEFSTMKQQDAFEFFTHLVELIQTQCDNDPASKLFGFQTERKLSCLKCDAVRYKVEDQLSLSVQVPIKLIDAEEQKYEPVEFKKLLDLYTMTEEVDSKCPKCSHPQAKSQVGFKTVPQILVVNVRRFEIVNWVPRKIDVPVTNVLNADLESYKSKGPQPGENVIDESAEEDASEFVADPEQLVMLQSMGFNEAHCIAALKMVSEEGRPGDLELAMNHILLGEVNELQSDEQIIMLESMGFNTEQAKAALKANSNNVERAVDWLFAGKFDESKKVSGKPLGSDAAGNYNLNTVICHKGPSVHTGHYVASVLKNNEFILFNDEKVTKSPEIEELQKFAYIYMFSLNC